MRETLQGFDFADDDQVLGIDVLRLTFINALLLAKEIIPSMLYAICPYSK